MGIGEMFEFEKTGRFDPEPKREERAMKERTIEVGTRLQDNGDGGYTMYLYPSYDAAVAAKRAEIEEWEDKDKVEEMLETFDGDSDNYDYEYGYLGEDTLKVTIDEFDNVTLAEVASFGAGQ